MTISLSDEARDWLAERGYDPAYGARPLGRVVQEHVKKPLAEELLFGRLVDGGMALVDVASANDDGEITGLKVTAESPDDSSGKKTREGGRLTAVSAVRHPAAQLFGLTVELCGFLRCIASDRIGKTFMIEIM